MPHAERLFTAYAPVYDPLLGALTRPARAASVRRLHLRTGERVLVPGCGTGLDFPLLPVGTVLAAGDLTPAMVRRARVAAVRLGFSDNAVQRVDATCLPFADASFDAALLHFVVAVVPDPLALLRETARVLRPGGRLSVLDVFAPPMRPLAPWRRLANPLLRRFVHDVTREAHGLLAAAGFKVLGDVPAPPLGVFRALTAVRR